MGSQGEVFRQLNTWGVTEKIYIISLLGKAFRKVSWNDSRFQKATNDKKQFLRLPASENSIQKVLKTETQDINTMQVADTLRCYTTRKVSKEECPVVCITLEGEQQADPTVNSGDGGDHTEELLTAWRIPDQ
ncbi:hypothetical protein STEG23_021775, partial [Scotinomys teguina]